MAQYPVGAVVDGFVLTERGWVSALDLDPSPYRPGHVVDGRMLTADLIWQPLRRTPTPPYRVGDVVDAYVLTPSGDWRPLAAVTRARTEPSRRGGRGDGRAASTSATGDGPRGAAGAVAAPGGSPRAAGGGTVAPGPARPAEASPRSAQSGSRSAQSGSRQAQPGARPPVGRAPGPGGPGRRTPAAPGRPSARRTSPTLGFWLFTALIAVGVLRGCSGR